MNRGQLLEQIVCLASEIKQQRAEIERLRAALAYYADESNYNEDGAPVHRTSPMLDYESEEQDWGGVAREALEAKR